MYQRRSGFEELAEGRPRLLVDVRSPHSTVRSGDTSSCGNRGRMIPAITPCVLLRTMFSFSLGYLLISYLLLGESEPNRQGEILYRARLRSVS